MNSVTNRNVARPSPQHPSQGEVRREESSLRHAHACPTPLPRIVPSAAIEPSAVAVDRTAALFPEVCPAGRGGDSCPVPQRGLPSARAQLPRRSAPAPAACAPRPASESHIGASRPA